MGADGSFSAAPRRTIQWKGRRQTLIDACAQGFGRFRIPLPQGFRVKRLKTLRQAIEYALYIIDISS
ncbi:MAG: hypothetical protein MSS68_09330, partial [Clostridiales bacterium]|nr:hypothetical protein [Clostridiales bacterium]